MIKKIKTLLSLILCYAPAGLQKRVYAIREKQSMQKTLQKAKEVAKRTRVTKDEVNRIINDLELGDCDVMLHTSMMKIGRIDGGIKWVCKCLFDKIDLDKNTLLTVALPYNGRNKDFLETNPVFDVRTAPVAMGGINEHIASLPNAERSIHPTHSVVAIGKQAIEYTKDHHLDDVPFGPNSPYYKIIKNRGKIVMFGATISSLTMAHAFENMFGNSYPTKVYTNKLYKIKCISKDGSVLYVNTPCHNPLTTHKRDLLYLKDDLVKQNILKEYPIGEGSITIIDAYKFSIHYLNEMKKGKTTYGKIKVCEELRMQIEEIIKTL
jgi:aminoglycoside 3-N-acetyltransferase